MKQKLYEHPDVQVRLAYLLTKDGVKRSTVESAISKFYHGRLKTCPYRVVEIEEEE